MSEPYLTKAEIDSKYPNEWVFVTNPKCTRSHSVLGGHVAVHSADRVEFYQLVGKWNEPAVKQTASWYTGEVGKWLAEVLPADAGSEPGAA